MWCFLNLVDILHNAVLWRNLGQRVCLFCIIHDAFDVKFTTREVWHREGMLTNGNRL